MSSSLKTTPAESIRELLTAPEVFEAFSLFEVNADSITEEQICICSIPAAPFGEQERAIYLREKFGALGLENPSIDEEGNCLGLWRGKSMRPLLVVSAHLDTVFSAETDFSIRRANNKLFGPGISDDGCGLAALIAFASALRDSRIQTEGSILFVGTVGEEGEGNLRGVRSLFTKGSWANQIDFFLSFDGPGVERITNQALGSKRYRVELRGSGGHSWGDFGTPNPVHALGRAISRLAAYPAPREPRTTFNVGRIAGGTSVNAIPHMAVMDVDLRSADEVELRRLDAYFRRVVRDATDEENSSRRLGASQLELNLRLVGERPSGETPGDSSLVEIAEAATKALGIRPRLDQSSTDSNLPISLGVPAITLGAGGDSGFSHTPEEWYDPRGRDKGLKRGLLVILAIVGLATRTQ